MTWIFGYGSLIWDPSFAYRDARPACLHGWRRRFWQGSPDHRGTLTAPGRVVTLVEDEVAACWGIAFNVSGSDTNRIFDALDARESGGYVRMSVDIEFADDTCIRATTYLALPDNDNFLGPASTSQIAAQIRDCAGRSGHNVDYVLRLASALRDFDVFDEEVHGLEACLKALIDGQ